MKYTPEQLELMLGDLVYACNFVRKGRLFSDLKPQLVKLSIVPNTTANFHKLLPDDVTPYTGTHKGNYSHFFDNLQECNDYYHSIIDNDTRLKGFSYGNESGSDI